MSYEALRLWGTVFCSFMVLFAFYVSVPGVLLTAVPAVVFSSAALMHPDH